MAKRIEKLLDALDERLAKGEISEETYKELKAKYSARLEKITGKPQGKISIEEIGGFLYSLERRFIQGEINEAAYLKLRKEYEQKLEKAYGGSGVIEGANQKPSVAWYLVPFFLGIIGGIIGYVVVKDDDKRMANDLLIFGVVMTVIGAIIAGAIWAYIFSTV